MKKLIVTGGLGFIGSNLVKHLLKQGYYVINIDKVSYASNFYNVKEFKNNKSYKFIKINISNKEKLSQIIKRFKPKCIFNLAAETHVDRSIDQSDDFIRSNIKGVHTLLEILIKNRHIKLIHISTDEVFGSVKKNLRTDENSPYKPLNPYAATKAASDHLINSYVNTYNVKAIITNCCNNYGPKQNPEKFIPKIISCILNKKKIPVYGKGNNSREWIYVEDHCKALHKVYLKGKIGETYNIGSNLNLRNIDLVKKIILISKQKNIFDKKSKVQFVKDRPGHDLRYALNSKKIRSKLKWSNSINIKEGLLKTINWYENNKDFYKMIKNKKFKNRLGLRK
jgi:dTDP-glucose 4,6-dehydratase